MIPEKKLSDFVTTLKKNHPQTQKIYVDDPLPDKIYYCICKKFQHIDYTREKILFAGIYPILFNLFTLGIVLTDRAIHYRLQRGFMAMLKSEYIPLLDIQSISAQYKLAQDSYQGGNPGPAFFVNEKEIGWTQMLMVMSQADVDCLMDLFNNMNALIE